MSELSNRILALLEEKGLSYGELAELTKIPKSALQRYATGETEKIPIPRIDAIAKALGVTSAYLIGWSEDEGEHQAGEEKQPPAAGELSEDEVILLQAYRALPEHEKQNVLSLLRLAAGQAQGDQGGPG